MNIQIPHFRLILGISASITGISLVVVTVMHVPWTEPKIALSESPSVHASAQDTAPSLEPLKADDSQTSSDAASSIPLAQRSVIVHIDAGTSGPAGSGMLSVAQFPQWIETYRTIVGTDAQRINASAIRDSLEHGDIPGIQLMRNSMVLSVATDKKNVERATTDQVAKAGYVFDTDAASDALAHAIMNGTPSITIAAQYQKPTVAITKADGTTDTLELLSTAYSDFSNSTPGRHHNVYKVINERLNNVLVPAGSIYSHVAVLDAPITVQKGWMVDLGLFGGGAALTPGAGICQSSTTLYRGVLLAGLPIVEFKSHSLFVDHYEFYGIGLDATVFPGTHDFRFRNDTGDDVVIQAYINEPTVVLNIFGKKTGRTVKMDGPYFAASKNRPKLVPPLSRNQIAWVREIAYADGTVKDEERVSTYAKPVWNFIAKKYIGANGAMLLVRK